MNFGVPNQRKRREEKYPNTPILTIDVDGGKGTSRKMFLNGKAEELLGLGTSASVAFSFPDNGDVMIANGAQGGIPDEYCINVTKGSPRKVSDKRTYDYISKINNLDNTVENHFELGDVITEGGVTAYKLIAYPSHEAPDVDENDNQASTWIDAEPVTMAQNTVEVTN